MLEIVRQNPKAFAIAVLVHVLLFVLLSLNLDWTQTMHIVPPQQEIVQAVMVDDAKLKAEQEKKRQVEERHRQEEEERLQREVAQKQLEEQQRQQEREVEQRRAEAEAKRVAQVREAEEKRVAEAKRKAEAEKERKIDEEKQRQAEAEKKRKAAEERKRQEAEDRRLREEQMRQEELAAEQQQKQVARQRELDSEKNKYMFMIQQRVESRWLKPSGWQPGTSCKVRVRLVPGAGTAQVIDVRIMKSCGQSLFDRSVESAVFSASPLPFPTALELISEFREIVFDFKPEG